MTLFEDLPAADRGDADHRDALRSAHPRRLSSAYADELLEAPPVRTLDARVVTDARQRRANAERIAAKDVDRVLRACKAAGLVILPLARLEALEAVYEAAQGFDEAAAEWDRLHREDVPEGTPDVAGKRQAAVQNRIVASVHLRQVLRGETNDQRKQQEGEDRSCGKQR